MLVPCLAYSSTPKIELICSSETSVDFHRTTRRYIPDDRTIYLRSPRPMKPLNKLIIIINRRETGEEQRVLNTSQYVKTIQNK
jgi:hypothetical protein